jgi:hypothetical protein
VHAAQKKLSVFYGAEGVLHVHLACTYGLDLGAEKLYTGFIALKHKIFMKCLAVFGYLLGTALLCHRSHFLFMQYTLAVPDTAELIIAQARQ